MRDCDVLEKNPHITSSALEAIHSHVFGWALSRCNFDHAVAEDLMQQAYVELLSGNARFDNKSSLQTFVFGVVQNLARSRLRRLASRLRLVRHNDYMRAVTTADATDADASSDVWVAVQQLPARQRDIVELIFCRDLTIAEASAVMGVSIGTGRTHYDRAKKALKLRLQETRELDQ
ncbi:MAG: RNA polymerase sigma factor [Woeseiaceae bacterium]